MIEVRLHHRLEELDRPALEALNLEASHASPFNAPSWLEAFLAHDGGPEHGEPWFLVARDLDKVTGFLPLKLVTGPAGRKLTNLITLEIERPGVVARAGDEARVASAFYRFLMNREGAWDLLELNQQEPGSPLYAGPEHPGHHWLRRRPDRDNNVVPLTWQSPKDLIAAMSSRNRWTTKKHLVKIFAQPALSVWWGDTPATRTPLFELVLDIERRSWKPRSEAGIGSREGTYRAVMASKAAAFQLRIAIICLGDEPIGAGIYGHYARASFSLQSVFAEAHEALAPGSLLLWLGLLDAMNAKLQSFDLLPDYSYYKSRWLAKTVPTETLQLFRPGSRYHLKALLGDFKRRVVPEPPPVKSSNPYREAAGKTAQAAVYDPAHARALLEAARVAGAKQVIGAELAALNPFTGEPAEKAAKDSKAERQRARATTGRS